MPLKGIPKVLTPDILHALSSMGHGDEIVLADAHFPASSICKTSLCKTIEIRADACYSLPHLLKSILKLLPLDNYVKSSVFSYLFRFLLIPNVTRFFKVFLMDLVDSDKHAGLDVKVWKEFQQILDETQEVKVKPELVERFQFYEQAKKAFAIIQTGDNAKYGNIILKKGLALE